MSKKHSHTLEYSDFIIEELRRLENGNASEKQRFHNIQSTTARIQSDPLNREFNKDLPENYKAAAVLQQYRLFFKIEHIDENNSVIFITWINNENTLHVSGDKNDTYVVFRKLLKDGNIEAYKHVELEDGKKYFNHNGDWGDDTIYFRLTYKAQKGNMLAYSHIYLNRQTKTEYRIDSVSVTHTEQKLTQTLLGHICNEAGKKGYKLCHELNTNLEDVDKNRHILEKYGFTINIIIDDTELWEWESDPSMDF